MEKDIKRDPFEEYIREADPSRHETAYYWQTAIGLQAVDGLEPSGYLKETAKRNIEGNISIARAQELIESYYQENPKGADDRTEEADKVSARIAAVLAEKAFVFSSTQYLSIHGKLFKGIYSHAGKIRDYNITKNEWVLDGDTVLYGGAAELRETLEYDLRTEQDKQFEEDAKKAHAAIMEMMFNGTYDKQNPQLTLTEEQMHVVQGMRQQGDSYPAEYIDKEHWEPFLDAGFAEWNGTRVLYRFCDRGSEVV